MAVMVLLSGCRCFSTYPTDEQVNAWLAAMPPGSSGSDAYRLLKSNGFSPECRGLEIWGSRETSNCLGAATWVEVSVKLDEAGRVVSATQWDGQTFP
jgi:hypothetical protein